MQNYDKIRRYTRNVSFLIIVAIVTATVASNLGPKLGLNILPTLALLAPTLAGQAGQIIVSCILFALILLLVVLYSNWNGFRAGFMGAVAGLCMGPIAAISYMEQCLETAASSKSYKVYNREEGVVELVVREHQILVPSGLAKELQSKFPSEEYKN